MSVCVLAKANYRVKVISRFGKILSVRRAASGTQPFKKVPGALAGMFQLITVMALMQQFIEAAFPPSQHGSPNGPCKDNCPLNKGLARGFLFSPGTLPASSATSSGNNTKMALTWELKSLKILNYPKPKPQPSKLP